MPALRSESVSRPCQSFFDDQRRRDFHNAVMLRLSVFMVIQQGVQRLVADGIKRKADRCQLVIVRKPRKRIGTNQGNILRNPDSKFTQSPHHKICTIVVMAPIDRRQSIVLQFLLKRTVNGTVTRRIITVAVRVAVKAVFLQMPPNQFRLSESGIKEIMILTVILKGFRMENKSDLPMVHGAKTIDNLTLEARAMQTSLWGALTMENRPMPPKLVAFRSLIESLREKAEGKTLSEVARLVIQGSGLKAHYEKEREGEDRIANMNEVMSAADGYCQNEGVGFDVDAFTPFNEDGLTPLQGFLSQATLEAGDKNETETVDAVQLMTVHAAKGLEFKNVFIVGLEEGIFPHFSAVRDNRQGNKGLAEERRLMYVAVTRAKRRLYLSHCRNRRVNGEFRQNPESQFIGEIPAELVNDQRTDDDYDYAYESPYRRRSSEYGWERPSFGGSRGRESYGRSSYGRDYDDRRGSRYGSSGYGSGYGSGGFSRRNAKTSETKSYVDEATLKKIRAEASGQTDVGLRPGTRLRHETFGEGIVQSLQGEGSTLRVKIEFENHGLKEVLWDFAKNRTKILD